MPTSLLLARWPLAALAGNLSVDSPVLRHAVRMSLALGYVKTGTAEPGDEVEVMVLGQPHKARILHEPPFDPKGEKLRA